MNTNIVSTDFDFDSLSQQEKHICFALSLWWTKAESTVIISLASALRTQMSKASVDSLELPKNSVPSIIQGLVDKGIVVAYSVDQDDGYNIFDIYYSSKNISYTIRKGLRSRLYLKLLQTYSYDILQNTLLEINKLSHNYLQGNMISLSRERLIGLYRLAIYSGQGAAFITEFADIVSSNAQLPYIHFYSYISDEMIEALYERINIEIRLGILLYAYRVDNLPQYPPAAWLLKSVEYYQYEETLLAVAVICLYSSCGDMIEEYIAKVPSNKDSFAALRSAVRGAALVQQGNWQKAQQHLDTAFKLNKNLIYSRDLSFYYLLSLLAQGSAAHLQIALKFCKSKNRFKDERYIWSKWLMAISIRLGIEEFNEYNALDCFNKSEKSYDPVFNVSVLLIRAWLNAEFHKINFTIHYNFDQEFDNCTARLNQKNYTWLSGQVKAARAIVDGKNPQDAFFVQGGSESWRSILSSILAINTKGNDAKTSKDFRILWELELTTKGALRMITPYLQKRGARDWLKPSMLSLSKFHEMQGLSHYDEAMLGSISLSNRMPAPTLDYALAIKNLIGHPHVILLGHRDRMINLVAGNPRLEATQEGENVILKIQPQPHPLGEVPESLRYLFFEFDTPQQIRVIQLSPEQIRAIHLVSGGLSLPVSAQKELQEAMQTLSNHFNIQSDELVCAREVASNSNLRVELSPFHNGLNIRLIVAPFGPEGPRLVPGKGKEKLIINVNNESVGTCRDIAAEKANLLAAMTALEFIGLPDVTEMVCEWSIDDIQLSLEILELLPNIPQIEAIDWPRGKPFRLTSLDLKQVQFSVNSAKDWFTVSATFDGDPERVISFQELLKMAAEKSRFIALGDGGFLALSNSLRHKLRDIAAVSESHQNTVRVPYIAIAWLDEVLAGTEVERDRQYLASLEKLQQAQSNIPALPKGLQAELRPYQEEGYYWASRLASAGFGACLADDMGLGKTLQALALLVARASGGPALVIAPTSVCSNWLAEAQRFAPSLRTQIFGDGCRETMVQQLAPGDVLVVSYTLMQQSSTLFSSIEWHTLVADEAQAIKNATAKRSKALYGLSAKFRIALSGTPIENRLVELWSIMRFCNPGLLGSLAQFNHRFANSIEKNQDRDAQRLLKRLVSPFILRRTKAEVLPDLPARTESIFTVVADAEEKALYEALRQSMQQETEELVESGAIPEAQVRLHILARLMKLRRAACDPRLVMPEFGKVGAKVRAFTELAMELVDNGHKALVFSQFVDFLSLLRIPLDEKGISYQYLDGSTPAADRFKRVEAFQAGESDLFLISLKAGGFGLNLTAADYVVIADPWWNPAAEDQAMGRAHRIGQLRPVTVYRLVNQGTLEERIIDLHHEKRSLAEGILDSGSEGASLPTAAELIALMRD